MITNPILPGFNPDPSILRVGEDYYIATSTFQWFPGVQIHHSRDLVHWRLLTRPLDRLSQLNMLGNPDSGGIWAPCLSYSDGLFYLVYTDVKSHAGAYKDTHNYVVTSPSITGPWSDPVYLNSNGFDPSLFHDDDGRKWVVNMAWDFRKNRNSFNGIYIREYSASEGRLIGPSRRIFEGSELGLTEGPHLYKKDGYYYLMVAEGGTSYEHAVTVARSRELFGPYEADPQTPVVTSWNKPRLQLQKAGHGSLVETQTGEWYLAHLCGRPLEGTDRCNLGRETAIQRCAWTDDGWLRLAAGGNDPQDVVIPPALEAHPFPPVPEKDDFDGGVLNIQWQSLRRPFTEEWISLSERPGYARIRGMESPNSRFLHSLIGRRQQAFRCEAETKLEFSPESYQQMAGLTYYYNSQNYYYLRLSWNEDLNAATLAIIGNDHGIYREYTEREVPVPFGKPIELRLKLDQSALQFEFRAVGGDWTAIGPVLDASQISDEYATHLVDGYFTDWGFTGAFIGLCVQDLSGGRLHADFDYFIYRETEDKGRQ
ncbi:glycoside hydrolase family 43 protein [Cohnella silvisoli]|uniref:Glycoside hydrolase family 43 protein n=1 Tax=Cohnella silvisoli TaxID=2873699 RepID=A0ABV1KXU6_9BACL|nr:glycoside hydrolase family 43 protein [Cohnella silvisoli]MCD9023715.1 glycoside hydrolase family 43 protein [Cohnella silvisoli]